MIQKERFVWYYSPARGKECFCEACIDDKDVRASLKIYKSDGVFQSNELGELFERKNEVIDEEGISQMEYLTCTSCGEELFYEDVVLFFDNGESVAKKISVARAGFGRLIFDDKALSAAAEKYDKKFNLIISACQKEISKSYGRTKVSLTFDYYGRYVFRFHASELSEGFLLFCEKNDVSFSDKEGDIQVYLPEFD
jgi:hypothetical protein